MADSVETHSCSCNNSEWCVSLVCVWVGQTMQTDTDSAHIGYCSLFNVCIDTLVSSGSIAIDVLVHLVGLFCDMFLQVYCVHVCTAHY